MLSCSVKRVFHLESVAKDSRTVKQGRQGGARLTEKGPTPSWVKAELRENLQSGLRLVGIYLEKTD